MNHNSPCVRSGMWTLSKFILVSCECICCQEVLIYGESSRFTSPCLHKTLVVLAICLFRGFESLHVLALPAAWWHHEEQSETYRKPENSHDVSFLCCLNATSIQSLYYSAQKDVWSDLDGSNTKTMTFIFISQTQRRISPWEWLWPAFRCNVVDEAAFAFTTAISS